MNDLSYTVKEYMDKLETKVDRGFEKISERFDKMETMYAKKSSVDKLRVIVWSIISAVFLYLGSVLLPLLQS